MSVTKSNPLFLVDMDGVISEYPRGYGTYWREFQSLGQGVAIKAESVLALDVLSGIVESPEDDLIWMTAWRWDVFTDIVPVLRETLARWPEKMRVISDKPIEELGWMDFHAEWKIDALVESEWVAEAVSEGRPVYWIEDFHFANLAGQGYGKRGAADEARIRAAGVIPIDTGGRGHFDIWHLLDQKLLERGDVDSLITSPVSRGVLDDRMRYPWRR